MRPLPLPGTTREPSSRLRAPISCPRPFPIFQPPDSVLRRQARIAQLLPMVSALRQSRDPDAILCAQALQAALVDMQRLNDAEQMIAQRGLQLAEMDETLKGIVNALTRD